MGDPARQGYDPRLVGLIGPDTSRFDNLRSAGRFGPIE